MTSQINMSIFSHSYVSECVYVYKIKADKIYPFSKNLKYKPYLVVMSIILAFRR